ncbi:hypothetical protein ABZ070_21165 [Streptomyces sp. NPDC006283]|uniref:hypothetical protein n=1 Tax=Streptomyces sp. NPDC006283 TaxID=3156741 RepID=UPI0033A3A8BE
MPKEVEDRIAQAPKDVKEGLTRMLDLIEDPNTTPENRIAYTRIVETITKTLKTLEGSNTPPEDRAAYTRIAKAITEAARKTPTGEIHNLVKASDALGALGDPQTMPQDPSDRKWIQKIVEEICNAITTAGDPRASQEERDEAQRKLQQLTESLEHSQYLEFMKEIKRYKPPTACTETIEDRTRQAGWPDGSLWGLSDPSCSAAVAEGARQEGSQWHALMACVLQNPFSTCVGYVPKD